MDLLEPAIQPYAWGSRHIIADLMGRPVPSPGPEAELWMGAHPAAPSRVVRGQGSIGLDEVVAAAPESELGDDLAGRFQGRLPFLLKVLAAQKALSLQVHPDRATAQAGYHAERAQGIPVGAGNYVDDWPKPEILCALTPFEALAGMREAGEAAALLRDLGVPALDGIVADLDSGQDAALVEALRALVTWPQESRGDLLTRTVEACAAQAERDGEHARAYAAVVRISADHPGDLGAVASLLLNHTVLAPGHAVYMAAGGLHAYLRGAGIEVLANSDNVLRAGLTGKHIDVEELCRIVDPSVGVPVLRPEPDDDGVSCYQAPVPEFTLHRVQRRGGSVALPGTGPRIVFVVDGQFRLLGRGADVTVGRGASAFVSALDGPVECVGAGTAFVASPGMAH